MRSSSRPAVRRAFPGALVGHVADVSHGPVVHDGCDAVSIGLTAFCDGCDGGMGGRLSAPGGFFANADFDYETRIALGAVPSGVGDVGLVLAILDRITDGDPQSWFDAWSAVAADLAVRGDAGAGARASGHRELGLCGRV